VNGTELTELGSPPSSTELTAPVLVRGHDSFVLSAPAI
jgi:hypothetical protein